MAEPSSLTSASGRTVRLLHATAIMRADNILQNGPDPNFVVGGYTANGFSTAPKHGPYPLGTTAMVLIPLERPRVEKSVPWIVDLVFLGSVRFDRSVFVKQ